MAAACSSDDDADAPPVRTTRQSPWSPTPSRPIPSRPTPRRPAPHRRASRRHHRPPTTEPPVTTDAALAAIVPDQWTAVDPGRRLHVHGRQPVRAVGPARPTRPRSCCTSRVAAPVSARRPATSPNRRRPSTSHSVGHRRAIGGLFDQTNPRESARRLFDGLRAVLLGRRPHRQQDHRVLTRADRAPQRYVNATAGLDHLIATYPDVEELLVMGPAPAPYPPRCSPHWPPTSCPMPA